MRWVISLTNRKTEDEFGGGNGRGVRTKEGEEGNGIDGRRVKESLAEGNGEGGLERRGRRITRR